MKDKRIGKTIWKYLLLDGHHRWQHPIGSAILNETQMDEMNAVDVEPPVVIEPFEIRRQVFPNVGTHTVASASVGNIELNVCYQVSARLIDGEARLVAEKVQP